MSERKLLDVQPDSRVVTPDDATGDAGVDETKKQAPDPLPAFLVMLFMLVPLIGLVALWAPSDAFGSYLKDKPSGEKVTWFLLGWNGMFLTASFLLALLG